MDNAVALARVRTAIVHMVAYSRLVQFETPSLASESANPWLRFADTWENDPDCDQLQSGASAFR